MDDAWREQRDDFVEEIEEEEELEIVDPGRTIAEDLVVTKYKMAGQIVNRVLQQVVERCVEGASICDLCAHGDALMLKETGNVFKRNKDMRKGIAFPTCVSVDHCVCHFSPITGAPDHLLGAGEVVKVELGGHVDGFIASGCHTLVVGGGKVDGRRADVVLAAHHGLQAALRTLVPGNTTRDVANAVYRAAQCYDCRPIDGTFTNQLRQQKPTGGKRVILYAYDDERRATLNYDIECHEVYALEVAVSTGEGTPRETDDARTTVYRKIDDCYYQLKLKSSRAVLSDVMTRHDAMPFSLRCFPDVNKARLGLVECLKHGIVCAYPVLYERPGELVAVFKTTVLVMPGGLHCITGLPFDPSIYHSEYSCASDPSLVILLAQTVNLRTIKKKKQKKLASGLNVKSLQRAN